MRLRGTNCVRFTARCSAAGASKSRDKGHCKLAFVAWKTRIIREDTANCGLRRRCGSC